MILITYTGTSGWVIYKGDVYEYFYLLKDLKWHSIQYKSNKEIEATFYYKTKEEAEATLLKWEATVP